MQALESLSIHLENRLANLTKAKEDGSKIVGYTPGGYLPEELVLAYGAIPIGLIRGGEHEPVMAANENLPRWLDTFCRAQVGYKILKKEPLYDLINLLVVPVTDNNIREILAIFEMLIFIQPKIMSVWTTPVKKMRIIINATHFMTKKFVKPLVIWT